LLDFGATPDMFEIRINHRTFLRNILKENNVTDTVVAMRLIDKIDKLTESEFKTRLASSCPPENVDNLYSTLKNTDPAQIKSSGANLDFMKVINGLRDMGIQNVGFSPSLARGFDYYTGTIFEIFDTTDENSRSLIGGGRYDNLTMMFGGDPISGIGFGMGDVTMRNFLETHDLLPGQIRNNAIEVTIIPMTAEENLFAEKVAMQIRPAGFSVITDIGTQKVDKKKARATERGSKFITIIGESEVKSNQLTIKNLKSNEEKTGQLPELINFLSRK